MAVIPSNGDTWIRTLIGAISAVAVTVSGMYTVVIVPQNVRIEKLDDTVDKIDKSDSKHQQN